MEELRTVWVHRTAIFIVDGRARRTVWLPSRSGDCAPQRVGGMSDCEVISAMTRQRLRVNHVQNPSTDSSVKGLTSMHRNMCVVCASGCQRQEPITMATCHNKAHSIKQPAHRKPVHSLKSPRQLSKKARECTSVRLSQHCNDGQRTTNYQ